MKLPSERRLVLDLIGLRAMLRDEVCEPEGAAERSKLPLSWVPTAHMEADGLTKRMDNKSLRDALGRGTLTIKEQAPAEDVLNQINEGWLTSWSRWMSSSDLTFDLDRGEADLPGWLD